MSDIRGAEANGDVDVHHGVHALSAADTQQAIPDVLGWHANRQADAEHDQAPGRHGNGHETNDPDMNRIESQTVQQDGDADLDDIGAENVEPLCNGEVLFASATFRNARTYSTHLGRRDDSREGEVSQMATETILDGLQGESSKEIVENLGNVS